MFGYINVNGKELSAEDSETYQAYYCGLCRQLQQDCGSRGRVLLSYDMTFLIVLLTGLYEPQTEGSELKCMVHPVKSHKALTNEVTEYAAAMNVILAYHNLKDDVKDDHNLSKAALSAAITRDYRWAARVYPRQAGAVEDCIRRLDAYEAAKETNIDLVAGLTGEMLGEIFAWKQDEWYSELKTFGFYLGKFIYMMDAYADIEEDEKKHHYNPFRKLKEENGQDFETLSRLMMTSMMSECARSFERLPIILHAEICRNILYSGVWSRYEFLQLKKTKRNKKNDRSVSGARSKPKRIGRRN